MNLMVNFFLINRGAQFGPQEALRIGLVDELVPNSEEAISKCQKYIESYAKVPGNRVV